MQKQASENTVFSWTAHEYIQQQKGRTWYILAGLIAVFFIILAIFTNNWTMAIAIIAFAIVYEYTQRQHPPKQVTIKITDLGIHVGKMVFPYSHIQAFWIIYNQGAKTLNLRVSKHFYSDVVIQLQDQDPVEIRRYLVGQISEWEGKDERLGDVIVRLLKL